VLNAAFALGLLPLGLLPLGLLPLGLLPLGLLPLGLLPLEGSGSGVTELPPTPQFEPKFGVHYMYI
jgi:hypothetical protein